MIFAWDEKNCEHLAKHHVGPEEAEFVVRRAEPPFPMHIGDEKLVVWGQTDRGRYLQVIFVLKAPQDVNYESLLIENWLEVETGEVDQVIRIIHAMELTPAMKTRHKKRRR